MKIELASGARWAGVLIVTALMGAGFAEGVDGLPLFDREQARVKVDWLVAPVAARTELYRTENANEIVLSNGLISRTFRLLPNGATVGMDNLMTGEAMLRGVKPEARVTLDGVESKVGGLLGQRNYAYLTPAWIDELTNDPDALQYSGYEAGAMEAPFPWEKKRYSSDLPWPPPGKRVTLRFHADAELIDLSSSRQSSDNKNAGSPVVCRVREFRACGPRVREEQADAASKRGGLSVAVHYEMYDGIPLLAKWLTVTNDSDQAVKLDTFTSEILAAVEMSSTVGTDTGPYQKPNIVALSDYMFGGDTLLNATRAIHWVNDPQYDTQVCYARRAKVLLESRPPVGPGVMLAPGESFETYRTFELFPDSTERERNGLATRRMFRTIAPWSTENPIMMHVRHAAPSAVRAGIDQCAKVGFELIILTFGSGFNIEREDPAYLAELKELADYAHGKGIEIGGYSLLASRSIDAENDVVNPATGKPGGFATFGNSPCLGSKWGQDYFRKLYAFYEKTGFDMLEHDGSYPGDVCASTVHPGHGGLDDSQYRQWRTITDFYRWCRGRGIYLNVPDFYYLNGANKSAMGYRETNWSLPRAEQVIHTRQNIYDGTWEKTPSMGWMFVPLTEYQGGGAAATIEPLAEHLDIYEALMAGLFGSGVQACYRGPRLYDTDETKAVVKKWVDFYKKYRDILDSDIIHVRRADGRAIDCMMHVNPACKEKALAMVFNPCDTEQETVLELPLYYTDLKDKAAIREQDGAPKTYELDRTYKVRVPVKLGPKGISWLIIE